MGGQTPPKKPSVSKSRQKALKCSVELKIHAITCPGVVLQSQEDIYLSVQIMGQYQKSKCVPPAFPLRIDEKMVFVKTFVGVVDPGVIAEHLENETTSLELLQLVPPGGQILATFEGNTREFLYPGPRLAPRSLRPEREILMKRSVSFPGISPKVEFSTTSFIEECEVKHGQPAMSVRGPSAKPCRVRTSHGIPKKRKPAPHCNYAKPTVVSQTRSFSPYTHRRMCQLSEETRQRLDHFKLGPYIFKKETVPQAPFVVPRSPNTSMIESPTRPASHFSDKRSPFHLRSRSFSADPTDPSLLGSFRSKHTRATVQEDSETRNEGPKDNSTPVHSMARDQSPVLNRSSLRERFQSPTSPSRSQEIHKRVQRVLNIHGALRKLSFDDVYAEEGFTHSVPGPTHCDSEIDSRLLQDRLIPGEPSVHLDDGTFWTNRAAMYTGKPHRAVFEESLSRIYKNLYRNASQSQHNGQRT